MFYQQGLFGELSNLSQGARAVKSGTDQEILVEKILVELGVLSVTWNVCNQNTLGHVPVVLFKQVPYIGVIGSQGKSDFLLCNNLSGNKIRIEVKAQFVGGSADEKLDRLINNCAVFKERDVIIIMEGNGFRPGTREYIVNIASKIPDKNINIFNIGQFRSYVKEIVPSGLTQR